MRTLPPRKKGFTMVELVIVIVVIAILAAVLIPTFATLVKKAKLTVDEQTVNGMNMVLLADEVLSGKPQNLEAAKAVLAASNYRSDITPTAENYEFYWIASDNKVVLVKMEGGAPSSIVYPEELTAKYASALPTDWYKLGENNAGAEIPQQRNGIENGIFYKDDAPFTGTENGYEFKNGNLVLKGVQETPSDSGSGMDNKLQYTIPTDPAYLTNKIIFNFDDTNQYFMPGRSGGNEIQIINTSGVAYQTASIKADGLDTVKNIISDLRTATNSGNTGDILQTLETNYGIDETYYPYIVMSDDFCTYMNSIDVTGLTSNSSLTQEQYNAYKTAVEAGNSFTKYLKDKYNKTSLSNLSWETKVYTSSFLFGNWPASNTTDAHGLFDGKKSDFRFIEPELVLLAFEHFYNQIAFVGVSDSDPTPVVTAARNGDNHFYKYDTEAWMTGVGNEYGVKLYSHIQASEGQVLSVNNINQFYVFTAQHGYLMTNAFQNYSIIAPTFEIILERAS